MKKIASVCPSLMEKHNTVLTMTELRKEQNFIKLRKLKNSGCKLKKEDYRAFVRSFGGSTLDFRRIWLQAVVKYNLIQLGYRLFGDNLKFKIQHNVILKRIIPL